MLKFYLQNSLQVSKVYLWYGFLIFFISFHWFSWSKTILWSKICPSFFFSFCDVSYFCFFFFIFCDVSIILFWIPSQQNSVQCCIQTFWYRLNVMSSPKKCAQTVPVTLSPYVFHVKTKWNIVYKYLKTKTFSRDTNILPQMYGTSNIFGPSGTTIESFWVSLNYPILNLKKTVYPKNVWMQYWCAL